MEKVRNHYFIGKPKKDLARLRSERINEIFRILNDSPKTLKELEDVLKCSSSLIQRQMLFLLDCGFVDKDNSRPAKHFFRGEYSSKVDYSKEYEIDFKRKSYRPLPKKLKVEKHEIFWLFGGKVVQ